MEATLLDTNFEPVAIVDRYKSFIWTDRYDSYGDFELHMEMSEALPSVFKKGYYLWNRDSEHLMIIESLTVESDPDDGVFCTIAGRSLETLLMRRIVWKKTKFKEDSSTGVIPNLQNGIKKLLDENVIEPAIEARRIPNFIFEESTDEKITKLTLEDQYFGEDLYSIIHKLCQEEEIGFKLTLNDQKQLVFKLYAGVDRSYEQSTNPYVIFSPKHDNISSTNYVDSHASWKNVTLVAGEGIYNDATEETDYTTYVEGYNYIGIERREIFTDATSLSTDDGDGGTLSAEAYQAHLRQRGIDTLMENTIIEAFEGEIDPYGMFVYGEDFFVGDIVQLANEYGQEGRAYISEYVMTCDEAGSAAYPTFQTIQKGVYEE